MQTANHNSAIRPKSGYTAFPEAGEEELSMMTKIVDKMTKDLDLRLYHEGYKERIEV